MDVVNQVLVDMQQLCVLHAIQDNLKVQCLSESYLLNILQAMKSWQSQGNDLGCNTPKFVCNNFAENIIYDSGRRLELKKR